MNAATAGIEQGQRVDINRKLKIVLLISSLASGGAERQVVTLAKALHKRGVPLTVVVHYPNGCFEKDLREAGVPLVSLGKNGRWDVAGFLFRFIKTLRQERADVVYGCLGTERTLLALFRHFLRPSRIVWGVRTSNMDMRRYDWLSRALYRCEPRLSCRADLIISNSASGAELAVKRGFPADKTVIVHNGIDTSRFIPDAKAREELRSEWKIKKEEVLIGRVGRLDPMKDYPTFLKAARLLADWNDHIRFVCVGDGPVAFWNGLDSLCRELQLEDRLIWAGLRADMASVYNSLDVLCSASSFGEGFPNAVAEAMACGVPCVVTDVGDSAAIVGGFGAVVKPGDPEALAHGCKVICQRLRDGTLEGSTLRRHIETKFSVEALADRTLEALEKVVRN